MVPPNELATGARSDQMSQDEIAIREVLAAEAAWAAAYRTLDLAALESMMADEYAIIQPGGAVVDKAATLASLRSDQRHWQVAASDDLHVQVYGDTAVVRGRWIGKGVNHSVPFDYQARYFCVWVKRAGRWQMVADQSTEIGGDD